MTTDRPRRTARSFSATVALALAAFVVVADAGCVKECSDATQCQKTCECTDTQRNQIIDCAFMFTCELETETCESAYNEWSCDQICETVAARGLCGSKRCDTELDCHINTPCECRDPTSGAVFDTFECEKDIACNTDINVCTSEYALLPQQQCEICAAEQSACGATQ